uniref:2-phytyl-1,4-beta-naphthoquinone methyltransferase, chloroplastic n=1 Tax=Ananas comosus var. bracteatus TaxID=296719 RepID=A0A6V7Q596_ANACO|nr:unnamed protein product [Ananas comosus var. bracteatus]
MREEAPIAYGRCSALFHSLPNHLSSASSISSSPLPLLLLLLGSSSSSPSLLSFSVVAAVVVVVVGFVSSNQCENGDRVLDLCCGSGDLTFLLSQKVGTDGEVIALDFSRVPLSIASTRQEQYWKACYKNIKWVEGDALDLPFMDCYFDAITVGYGLRNLVDKPKAMQEIFRVLKPGSRASILDFNKKLAIDNAVVPLASRYGLAEEYEYLKGSIAEFLTGKELENLAKHAGFSEAKHYEIAGGLMGNLVATR